MNHETPYFYMDDVHVSAYDDNDGHRVCRIHQAMGFCHALMQLNMGEFFSPGKYDRALVSFDKFPLQALRDHKGTLMCKWGANPNMTGLVCIEGGWISQGEYSLTHFVSQEEERAALIDTSFITVQYNTGVHTNEEVSSVLDFWTSENLWESVIKPQTTFVKNNGNITNLDDFRK